MARKITTEAINAFMSGHKYKSGNTQVIIENNVSKLYLFSHLIAKLDNNTISITNADYFTNTTKERLNALPGVCISQKKGKWYLNGVYWDGQWTTI